MKKSLITFALLLGFSLAQAQSPVKVAGITIPQNGQGELVIRYEFTSEGEYTGYSMSLTLPDGISLMQNDKGKYIYTLGDCHEDTHQLTISYDSSAKKYSFGCLSLESDPLSGTSGVLLSFPLVVNGNLTVGSTLQATVQEINFAKLNGQTDFFNDVVEFGITITEPADTRTVLDETSTTVPASATNVDVRVKRTINANEWSTICLPFVMTEAQVKETFGNDVQLADFIGTDPEFDGDNVVAVTANFTAVQAIEANHPYIIKVSSPVSEFTLDGVDIVADEDEAYIEFDNGLTGRRRVVYSGFYGTYHAQTTLEEFTLFLNGNKFWYSAGLTKMKAFRAYFFFLDILAEVENGSANVKMFVNMDDEATGIETIDHSSLTIDHRYNLAGQRVGKDYKGIVIENGKKIKK